MREDPTEELRELEERLLLPDVRRSRPAVSALLADEFVEFGSSGRVYDRQQTLALLESAEQVETVIRDFAARLLTPEVALVTYRSVRRDTPRGAADALRSSIWTRRNGRWQMLFHQGTPVPQ